MSTEHPAGLEYRPDFVTPDEERQLIDFLERISYEEVKFRGVIAKRVVKHFGVRYEYESRKAIDGEPLPDELRWLQDRCAEFACKETGYFVEALTTRYPAGAGIGWHRDAPMFGNRVVGVSLGAACTMKFRRELKDKPREDFSIDLESRSVYMFSGAARWSWKHSIPAVDDVRYSITFRTLRDDAPALEFGA